MNALGRKMKMMAAGISVPLVVAGAWSPGAAQACGAASAANPYRDGAYTATGQYGSLPSSITVTLTLADGVITQVNVRTHATDPTSLDYQRRFAAAVPRVVVGRPIAQVKVGRLAGSSGTPNGFNAALEKIKAQACKE